MNVQDIQKWLPEIVDKIHDMIMADRRIKVREIEKAISYKRVVQMLHNVLGFCKIMLGTAFAQPRTKTIQAQISANCLEVKKNPTDFIRRFVTINDFWIHYSISPFDLNRMKK